MSPDGETILRHLGEVSAQRKLRAADSLLAERVRAVKHFQHARFERTYADLLAQPRYAKAARFFLEDLYGPGDFTARDDQFARIVPGLVRLFPHEIVQTVAALGELHALSETLDTAMGAALPSPALDGAVYGQIWRAVGRSADRERQIVLMGAVGAALDRYTRRAMLRHSLRVMRAPAQAAGLGALQRFLETGFDTFREMHGAEFFLATIAAREHDLAAHLFGGGSVTATPAAA